MTRNSLDDNATSSVLAWSLHAANMESVAEDEAGADADEPPDSKIANPSMSPEFRRTCVTRPKENHASLLTLALQSASEGEAMEGTPAPSRMRRRRSITSDVSVASTADLTSDTGMSTPARTNTPSPRLANVGFVPLALEKHHGATGFQVVGSLPWSQSPTSCANKGQNQTNAAVTEAPKDPAIQALEKKRCVSFACTAKPQNNAPKVTAQASAVIEPAQPKKSCIKFACPARPNTQQTHPQRQRLEIPPKSEESGSVSTLVNGSTSAVRKPRSPVASRSRPSTPRRSGWSPVVRKKYMIADSNDLQRELCHFHEFASDHPQEEDWIRQEQAAAKTKLTIDDLLEKENAIRRLGKEAEEEAEQEEQEAEEEEEGEEAVDEDDDGDNVEDEDEAYEDQDIEDDESGYGSDDDFSEGYDTDEEYGFAESDDEDDGLHLWTLNAHQSGYAVVSDATHIFHPSSFGAHHSDSSTFSPKHARSKQSRPRSAGTRPVTPELPDSTDFVCGTMDEDRPLEEAYLTRLAARKQEKLRVIPQDLDPTFPTSELEDNDDEELKHSNESGEHLWLHGELEDLDDEDRVDRRRMKSMNDSPTKRLRSPPPKHYHSPRPKARGRSPRRVLDRSSPKRMKSPAPAPRLKSPPVSPAQAGNRIAFKSIASRPGLTHTKSLPRGAYFPPHMRSGKRTRANTATKDKSHVRGAIDIVKGLEQKRQRRKEKFYQKYCNRARKGQIPEKKAQPGEGAERMRELGLLLAGKIGQGNYVISI